MANQVEVLITIPFPDDLLAQLRSISPRLRFIVHKATQTADILSEVWQRAEVLYTDRVLPTPEQAPNLRWIQFHWAGVDHAIDAPILHKSGLVATSLSGAVAPKIAEYVLALLLALGHRLPDLIDHQRKSDWPKDRWKRFSPKELNSSTFGIVGYGSIGREVARLAAAFGATILATKRDAMHPADSGYTPEGLGDPTGELLRRLYPHQALRSMLRECDYIVVTVPLTSETRNLIGGEELAVVKPSAYLIDISRGGIVNHAALIAALRERKIAGAALDVFPEEPLPADSPLWKFTNVIISPHISGNTPNYDWHALALFAENLQRYLSGQSLYNRIDPEKGY